MGEDYQSKQIFFDLNHLNILNQHPWNNCIFEMIQIFIYHHLRVTKFIGLVHQVMIFQTDTANRAKTNSKFVLNEIQRWKKHDFITNIRHGKFISDRLASIALFSRLSSFPTLYNNLTEFFFTH
jgi:hypothetical protein